MHKQKEANLPESFAENIQKQVLNFIHEGQSFSLIGMPSVGISPFLRFIENKTNAHTILLDVYELSEFSKQAFLELLYYKLTNKHSKNVSFNDCKEALKKLIGDISQVVIIINKIDLLASEFSESFFGNFRTLCYENAGKVSLLFSVNKPYVEYAPDAIVGSNMHIFSRYIYFTPYTENDLIELLKVHSPEVLEEKNLKEAILSSGGHIQLLQLILRSSTPNNLLHDPYIRLLIKHILDTLTRSQQRILQKIAEGKTVEMDSYLVDIGIVKNENNKNRLFSPLLTEFLLLKKSSHLPAKEHLLFQLLKKSNGKIISKEKIVDTVWKNDSEGATDWAVDSLLYRLRKHPVLKEKGYEIINHKKLGYQLIRT